VLLQVHFRLRVDSTQELAHPVLQRVRCRELALPELGTLPQPDFGGRNMLLNVDAVFAPAMAALDRHAASVAGLLSNPAFVLANGGSLAALRNLPPCAPAQAPQLLGGFHNLGSLGLQHTNFRSLNRYRLEELMQPAFFPPSLRHLRVWSNEHIACGGWLPSQHLESLELHAWMVTLGGSGQMGGHGCTSLTVHGASRLELGVGAMLGPRFDGLRRVVLSSVAGGGLRLCPLAADEAWLAHDIAQQPGAAEDPDGCGQALLRRWLRILSPLFLAADSSLQSFQATARNLQLATGIGEQQGSSLLPPHAWRTQGAIDTQASAAGLVAKLVYPMRPLHGTPNHPAQLCQLTVVRAN
jgi:hypothetical protein